MALKQSLSSPWAKTVVIATLSPASKDTEHSLNTLRHACIMDCSQKQQQQQQQDEGGTGGEGYNSSENRGAAEKETRFITGGVTKTVHLGEIDMSQFVAKRGEEQKTLTSNGNEFRRNEDDAELTEKEKYRQRRTRERAALGKLKETNLDAHRKLGLARKMVGQDEVQYLRLRASPPVDEEALQATEEEGDAGDEAQGSQGGSEGDEKLKKEQRAKEAKAMRLRNTLDSTVPLEMRLRQFRTLMKMNGLDPTMAKRILYDGQQENQVYQGAESTQSANSDSAYPPTSPLSARQHPASSSSSSSGMLAIFKAFFNKSKMTKTCRMRVLMWMFVIAYLSWC